MARRLLEHPEFQELTFLCGGKDLKFFDRLMKRFETNLEFPAQVMKSIMDGSGKAHPKSCKPCLPVHLKKASVRSSS